MSNEELERLMEKHQEQPINAYPAALLGVSISSTKTYPMSVAGVAALLKELPSVSMTGDALALTQALLATDGRFDSAQDRAVAILNRVGSK